MSERLRAHRDDLRALISSTADALSINPAFVEKDFWVTEVLRIASRPRKAGSDGEARFVFKGGTSLSRVHRLIERFSEDVDLLAVFPQDLGASLRHRVFKDLDAEVSEHLNTSGSVGPSETGIKRYTTYAYDASFGDASIAQGVLLELGSRGGAMPAREHEFRSMVALHAQNAYHDDATTWEEFAPFTVSVLAPERTLLEKLAAVHAAATAEDYAALAKSGRHFYDIARLLGAPEVTSALSTLGAEGVSRLVDDVNAHSAQAGFRWAERPEGGFADSAAFRDHGEIHDAILASYEAALALVYGARPPFEEVISSVHVNRDLL